MMNFPNLTSNLSSYDPFLPRTTLLAPLISSKVSKAYLQEFCGILKIFKNPSSLFELVPPIFILVNSIERHSHIKSHYFTILHFIF